MTTERSLFDLPAPVATGPGERQDANLERVNGKVCAAVLEFWAARLAPGGMRQFHMQELTAWVARNVPIAPDSAGRILRLMRQKGLIEYRVVRRSDSLYEVSERGAG
jgi:hypothetical protein